MHPKKKPAAPSWPADKVERRPIEGLVPYARNSRVHSDKQVDQIAASINEWGWTMPVLIDPEGGIIAGHGRVMAAQKLGLSEVPCMIAEGWSEAQRRAYVIADNQLTLNADWDEEILTMELEEIGELDFDIDLIGFDGREMDRLLGHGGPGPEEPPIEPPAVPISKLGDLWVLGDHRLICGDSTDADIVARLLDGEKPHLMVTDPPYGVNYDPDWRNRADRADGKPYGDRAIGEVKNDDKADWREAWSLFPGDVAYVWHADIFSPVVADSLSACNFEMRALVVWAKDRLVISRGHYHHMHEPCWYAVRKGANGSWNGDRKQTTLWQIEHRKSETGHGTQKPVECMKRPILNNSKIGDAVYEPFSGSGTTIVAAEMTDRRCFAIELDPAYVDLAVIRWQTLTGEVATLDGVPFDQVSQDRVPQKVKTTGS